MAGTHAAAVSNARELPEVVRALESMPFGILVIGTDGAIALANAEIERLFGFVRAELLGRAVSIVVPGRWWQQSDAQPAPSPEAAPVRAAGRETFGRRKDGAEIPLAIRVSTMVLGEGTFTVAAVHDLTERRRIETELQALRDERLQFETLLGELAAAFVRMRPEEMDRAIEELLARVVRLLDLDHGGLYELTDGGEAVSTHQWMRPGWPSVPGRIAARTQFPWHVARLRAGDLVSIVTPDDVPNPVDRASLNRLGIKSSLTLPVAVTGRSWALGFATVRRSRVWTPDAVARLQLVARMLAGALARRQADEAMRARLTADADARKRLQRENGYLQQELQALAGAGVVVAHSPGMRRVLEQIRRAAPTREPVLLLGEIGTGKSLLAARVHESSVRAPRPLLRVRCASLAAVPQARDLFAGLTALPGLGVAERSTVYLDEIADLPLDVQGQLLDVMTRHRDAPAAGRPDVRVIASSRRDLARCVEAGSVHRELYVTLTEFAIPVPPLRERREDIPPLVWRFVDEFSEMWGRRIESIDAGDMSALERHAWPGNARELRSVIEQAMMLDGDRGLHIPSIFVSTNGRAPLSQVEREYIRAAIAAAGGTLSGQQGAAARLGLTPRALTARMARLGLRTPSRRRPGR